MCVVVDQVLRKTPTTPLLHYPWLETCISCSTAPQGITLKILPGLSQENRVIAHLTLTKPERNALSLRRYSLDDLTAAAEASDRASCEDRKNLYRNIEMAG